MKALIITLLASAITCSAIAQDMDSLMNRLDSAGPHTSIASFKSNRLILSQTTTMVKKYDLDFKVVHRFGDIGGTDGGSRTFWGLDNSTDIYIELEYGISDRFNIGFGRSKYEQLLDLQLKYALLQQKDKGTPVSLSLLAQAGFTPYKVTTDVFDEYSNRFSYFAQAILSRKFSDNLSLQIAPGVLFRNLTQAPDDEANLFSVGIAGRYKFSKRFGIVADYYLISSDYRRNHPTVDYYAPLGLGLEIETGGHVFTLNFVNSKAIVENNYLPNSTSSWENGGYRFGFSISRMFTLYRPK